MACLIDHRRGIEELAMRLGGEHQPSGEENPRMPELRHLVARERLAGEAVLRESGAEGARDSGDADRERSARGAEYAFFGALNERVDSLTTNDRHA
jgi:hypothetical protein